VASARARRYARAVFEVAEEEGQVDQWTGRLEALRGVLTNPQAAAVLASPAIPPARRVEAMEALATRAMGAEGLNLGRMLVAVRRPDLIEGIVEEYRALADEAAGRVRATVTTAVGLSPADEKRIAGDLSSRLGKQVTLEVEVDPAIIGGLVLHVGDRKIDASIATKLQQLRRRLATA
jgi:F-type H+-transporting ATPase subunit delta